MRLYRLMLREKAEIDEIEARKNVYFIHFVVPWNIRGLSLKSSKTMVMLEPQ